MKGLLGLSVFSVFSVVSVVPAFCAFSGDDSGTASAQFLKLPPDARALALGEAYSAVADDAAAAWWNPAGLAGIKDSGVHLSHAVFLDGIYHDFAALAVPLAPIFHRRGDFGPLARFEKDPDWGTLAMSVVYLNAGTFSRLDNTGAAAGQFAAKDTAAQLGWGRSFGGFDAGVTLKYVNSKIDKTAVTAAADLGVRWQTQFQTLPWTLALTARNLGPGLKFDRETSDLPASYRLGSALRLQSGQLLAADLVLPVDGDPYGSVGLEAEQPIGRTLAAALRAGFNTQRAGEGLGGLSGVSAGAGVRTPTTRVDYAWVPYGDLGHTHRFSVGFRF